MHLLQTKAGQTTDDILRNCQPAVSIRGEALKGTQLLQDLNGARFRRGIGIREADRPAE
jgi:hypothetical protein